MWAKIKGFLAAILSLVVLCATAIGVPAAVGDTHNLLKWAELGAAVALGIAPIAVALIGIPALEKYGRRSLRAYLWTGFGISAALAMLSATTLPASEARGLIQVFETIIILIAGPLAAAVYWKVTRPDRIIRTEMSAAL